MAGCLIKIIRISFDISENKEPLPDYEHIRAAHENFKATDGKQIGNPDKVADVLIKLVNDSNPPANLFIGSDAYERASAKIETLTQSMKNWKEFSFFTDFQ